MPFLCRKSFKYEGKNQILSFFMIYQVLKHLLYFGIKFDMFTNEYTVVPGFSVLGFSALNPGDGAWSVHKTLFGFKAPLSKLLIKKISFEF